jgi:hypothetical protein
VETLEDLQVVYSFLLDGKLFVGRTDNQRAMDVDEVCSVIAASTPTTDHRASTLTTVLQFTHATRHSGMSCQLSLMGQVGHAAACLTARGASQLGQNGHTTACLTAGGASQLGQNGHTTACLTVGGASQLGQNGRTTAVANGTDYKFTTEDRQRGRGVRKTRTKKFHTGKAKSGATRSGGGQHGDCRNWCQGCVKSAQHRVEGLCRGQCIDANGDEVSQVSAILAKFIAAT